MKTLKLVKKTRAFSIVELLVVIVVIGILAAITVISYSGINNRALAASVQSDLKNGATKLQMYYVDEGLYPTSIDCTSPYDANSICIETSGTNTITSYTANNTANPPTFSLVIEDGSGSNTHYVTEALPPTAGTPAVAWDWADNTVWKNGGIAVTPTIISNPVGAGDLLLVDFNGWGYNFTTDKAGGKFHFDNGSTYTITVSGYGTGDYECGTDLRATVDLASGPEVDFETSPGSANWNNYFTADGTLHQMSWTDVFTGATGDYYLIFYDQAGNGDWYMGDITVNKN